MPTVLITVDSLRADHLGQYGYERDTMPVLDRLVDEGTIFEQAFSNGPYTRVSIPSFHTSRYLAYGNLDTFPTLASVLGSAGIDTAAIGTQTGIGLVRGEFGFDEMIDLGRGESEHRSAQSVSERTVDGINQLATGVSEWLQRRRLDRVYRPLRRSYRAVFGDQTGDRVQGYTSAEVVTDRAISWLDSRPDSEFFLWLHYMEAHRPYGIHDTEPAYVDGPLDADEIHELMERAGTSPEAVTSTERELMVDLYDSDLRYCSRHLDRLFTALEERGLWDETDVIFSSDHGEEFGEHGLFFHRNFPYDELIHVPLVCKASDGDCPETVPEQRTLLDLLPTICSLHGVETSGYGFLGTDLLEGDERDVIVLGQPGMDVPAVAVRSDGWKYIHTDDVRQLYDLNEDPAEQENLYSTRPEVADQLHGLVPDYLFGRDTKAPRPPEDDVDREHLAALGYMELRADSTE